MGYFTGDYNGCGWVATYNAAELLGIPQIPADIIQYYEKSGGTILDGLFGVNPLALEKYFSQPEFKDAGITAEMKNLPKSVDDLVKNSDIAIINYMHDSGMHYITVEYSDGIYGV
jgi:hypothetical protein